MSLNVQKVPICISPPRLCTPSRIAGEKTLSALLRSMDSNNGISNILDLGCGFGEYRFFFPGCKYIGIDIRNGNFFDKTDEMHHFIMGNASALPIKSCSQDLVLSAYAFQYFPDPKIGLSEIFRVLKPGGESIIFLPTKWVGAYEWLPELFKMFGVKIELVSAQPGIRHYNPMTILQLAKAVNFTQCRIVPIYGWGILLARLIQLWYRLTIHLSFRILHILPVLKAKNPPPLYISRKVGQAKKVSDWEKLFHSECINHSKQTRLYGAIVKAAMGIDRYTGVKPVVEYILLATKQR